MKNLRISVTIIHFTSVAVKSEIRKTSASMTQQTQSNVVFLAYQEVSSFLELVKIFKHTRPIENISSPDNWKAPNFVLKKIVLKIRPRGVSSHAIFSVYSILRKYQNSACAVFDSNNRYYFTKGPPLISYKSLLSWACHEKLPTVLVNFGQDVQC